jgi:PPIC-type PPIASE domain
MVCLLFGPMAWAQANPSSTAPPEHKRTVSQDMDDEDEKKPAAVAANAAVLTINGLCSKRTPNSAEPSAWTACQTVITRAQFDRLIDAVAADMSPQSKLQLATSYPRLLVRAHEAEIRGLGKTARFEELMRFARLQILSQELTREIKEESARVPEKEIVEYYREHSPYFELASVERIFVPLRGQAQATGDGNKDNAGEDPASAKLQESKAAMRNEAQDLRARAAAGEDFAKLQNEAYEAAGNRNHPLTATTQKVRRTSLPPAHLAVFDLKPSEVTPLISDASGYYIYKLDAKELEPLPEARAEIVKVLERQRLQDSVGRIDQSCTTDVNQSYFGTAQQKSEKDDD